MTAQNERICSVFDLARRRSVAPRSSEEGRRRVRHVSEEAGPPESSAPGATAASVRERRLVRDEEDVEDPSERPEAVFQSSGQDANGGIAETVEELRRPNGRRLADLAEDDRSLLLEGPLRACEDV